MAARSQPPRFAAFSIRNPERARVAENNLRAAHRGLPQQQGRSRLGPTEASRTQQKSNRQNESSHGKCPFA